MNQNKNPLQLTANRKLVQVNNNFGLKGISDQQATTRVIYDSIKITSGNANTYNFFKDVAGKPFPLTNLTQNKFQVGETMALQRLSVFVVVIRDSDGAINEITPLDTLLTGVHGFYLSEFNFKIAQDTVILQIPLTSMFAPFNKDAKFYGELNFPVFGLTLGYSRPHDILHFDNPVVVPPDINFIAPLQTPPIDISNFVAGFSYYLRMSIEGLGTLFSPKSNY